jgi:hypothetical protein
MVGKLIYLTNTRLDVLFDVRIISHYMSKPQVSHLNVVKHIPKYFRRITSCGIFYCAKENNTLQRFVYVD